MKKSGTMFGFWSYLKYIWKDRKSIYLLIFLFFPAYILSNYLQVYLPKAVVQALQEKQSIMHFGEMVSGLILLLAVGIFFREMVVNKVKAYNHIVVQKLIKDFSEKMLYVDYRYLEDPEFLTIRNKAKESIFGGQIGDARRSDYLGDFLNKFINVIAKIGMLLVYAWQLYLLSPWLLLVLVLVPFFLQMLNRVLTKHEFDYAKKASLAWQRLNYVTKRTEDFSMAKDVRLYQMKSWLSELSENLCAERLGYKKKELCAEGIMESLASISFALYYGFLFVFILVQFQRGNITISDVIFYAGMGEAVYGLVVGELLQEPQTLFRISIAFKRFQDFLDFGEDSGKKEYPRVQNPPEIRIKNMSFQYPGAEKEVLQNFNLTVKAGEKIAIVGVNGAGKTTLMKLICGLLHPTKGRILLDGRDMEEMEAEEKYAYFSCAFQDVHFLPMTVRENISMKTEDDTDMERVWECLAQAGIKKEIEQLPQKAESNMEKDIREDAVDFSGGQRQKLILARALYRETGALILDEPTSALDALAENDIYEKYAGFTEDKTSFFVSHRLSSTRFCDRIILIDGGNIAEEGTHEELLEQGGLYARMFELQSKYYKEETA